MNPSPDLPQLSAEEQGRLLARVYAFILSDQFTVVSREDKPSPEVKPARTRKSQSKPQETSTSAASSVESNV